MKLQFAMWGNSLALRIPQAVAREIRAAAGRTAEVTVQDGRLVVSAVEDDPRYDLDTLLQGMGPEHLHGETATGPAVGHEFG